jgi:outer membrane protein assembly factor BamA
MSLWVRWCCVAALIGSVSVSVAAQDRGTIVSQVLFDGNRRMSSQSLQAYIFTHPGDPYRKDALGRDVIALQNMKYFTSVRLEVKDDPNRANAKVAIFHLIEPPSRTTAEVRQAALRGTCFRG